MYLYSSSSSIINYSVKIHFWLNKTTNKNYCKRHLPVNTIRTTAATLLCSKHYAYYIDEQTCAQTLRLGIFSIKLHDQNRAEGGWHVDTSTDHRAASELFLFSIVSSYTAVHTYIHTIAVYTYVSRWCIQQQYQGTISYIRIWSK